MNTCLFNVKINVYFFNLVLQFRVSLNAQTGLKLLSSLPQFPQVLVLQPCITHSAKNLSVCVFVCEYHVHACTDMHVCILMCMCVYVLMHVCAQMCMYVSVCVLMCMCVCILICVCVHVCVYISIQMHLPMCAHREARGWDQMSSSTAVYCLLRQGLTIQPWMTWDSELAMSWIHRDLFASRVLALKKACATMLGPTLFFETGLSLGLTLAI